MIFLEFNRALISSRSSLHVRITYSMSSHRASILEKLNNRRVSPLCDVNKKVSLIRTAASSRYPSPC